jgi:tetratricopeptide (TPR) repeat protein
MLAYSGSCFAEIGRDMTRAEALLLEAQSLAARVGLELFDIFSGLGCVRRHQGHYDEARSLLQRAWRLTRAEQDHWRECTYLGYLAMLELEVDEPRAALPYCREMATVAARMKGESSEGAFAAALEALANYQLGCPQASAALEEAIATLQRIDAKRMLSYVLIGAAEIDLRGDRVALARDRAVLALTAAELVNHPSEIALAGALLVRATLALGDRDQAAAHVQTLHDKLDRYSLSVRACTAVDDVIQKIENPATANRVKK